MEIVIRPVPRGSYEALFVDAISCTYNMDGFTPMNSILMAYGLDREHFRKCARMHEGPKFRIICHGDCNDEGPQVITASKTLHWDSEPGATAEILAIADGERCESLSMTHFMFILGKFPEAAFEQCMTQVEAAKSTTNLKRIVVDVDEHHVAMARLIHRRITERAVTARAFIGRPLVLGLGTAAERLVKKLCPEGVCTGALASIDVEGIGDYVTGCDGSDFEREAIRRLVGNAPKVLLVVCGGGKNGAEMARFAAAEAHAYGNIVEAIVTVPASWEGRRRATRAKQLIDELLESGVAVASEPCDKHLHDNGDGWELMFSRVDDAMLAKIRGWCGLWTE